MGIAKLSELNSNSVDVYGGKATSLARMIGAGFTIPGGFVVDADSYQDMNARLEKDILAAFEDLDVQYVAVRSSALAEDGDQAAWAGQLDTFLNTTKDDLISNIQACWASLHSERARAYAAEHSVDIATQKVAVIVQAMVQSDVSGVAFSVHPVTQDTNQIVIEAAYGLGEAVVSGQVTPDTYVVTKDFVVDQKHIAAQPKMLAKKDDKTDWCDTVQGDAQKLDDEQIVQLAKIVARLELLYGFPVDVEWLVKDGDIYITQSRPITTLETKAAEGPLFEPGTDIFRWGPAPGHYFYIGDFIEAMYSAAKQRYGLPGFTKSNILFGDGRIVWLKRNEEFRSHCQNLFIALADDPGLRKQISADWAKARKALRTTLEVDPTQCNILELDRKIADFWVPTLAGEFGNYGSEKYLEAELKKYIPDDRERGKAMQVLTAPVVPSRFQQAELELARTNDLESYASKYHWIGNSYGEVLRLDAAHFAKEKKRLPNNLESNLNAQFKDIAGQKKQLIERYKLPASITDTYELILVLMDEQDERKIDMLKLQSYKQEVLVHRAGQLGVDWKSLLSISLRELADDSAVELSRSRGSVYSFVCFDGSIECLDTDKTEHYWRHYSGEKIEGVYNSFSGIIASRGPKARTSGIVEVVLDPGSVDDFPEGAILVTTMTSPEFMGVMRRCGGVVTDTGGLTSHAAILSRELNVPCIVGTKIASKVLQNGDKVQLDTHEGVVRVVNDEKA